MKLITVIVVVFIFFSNIQAQHPDKEIMVTLDVKKAEYLYHFAFDCIDREYPNKPGEVMGDSSYVKSPKAMHPAFYGCFDWHSSVHGHWALVTLLTKFPEISSSGAIVRKLKQNITPENISKEIEFLDDKHNKDFERTYGWAWLLKLDEALHEWKNPEAIPLQANLQPLADQVSEKFSAFLDKLIYPIRIGEHSNIAFAMSFSYDYAKKYNSKLALKIEEKARQYFSTDCKCPMTWEPGGFDFLSPCLQEAALMQKILPKKEFQAWLNKFMPGFSKNPSAFLKPAIVTDRTDGKLAHLDGLNFSRAWCLYEIGGATSNKMMIDLADKHFIYSYGKMDSGEYAGAHWLASFALYALIQADKLK